jgi:SET domain-containing protein
MTKLPHYKVYTRLAQSKIHGVGVFAIRNIKRGVYIFYDDNEDIIWVNKNKLKALPKEIKGLYEDFCIKNGDFYGCPENFNHLTPAWYLNHSAKPNLGCDKSYNFFALKKIKKGEELTVDYKTYSDVQQRRLITSP